MTLLHHFCLKFVVMLRLSIIFNHFLGRILGTGLQFVIVLIPVLLVFGIITINKLFLMFVYSTPLLHLISSSTLSATYCKHKQEKCCACKERVCKVEHGCFTPLIFSTSGGMGKAVTVFYKCLGNLLSTRHNVLYPTDMGWLCCMLFNFSLLKSSIMYVRGSSSSSGLPTPADLVLAESRVSTVCNIPP